MIEYTLLVAPAELEQGQKFSAEVLVKGTTLINEAVQQFKLNGIIPRETVQRLMQTESIVFSIDFFRDAELLMRNADSEQWYHVVCE